MSDSEVLVLNLAKADAYVHAEPMTRAAARAAAIGHQEPPLRTPCPIKLNPPEPIMDATPNSVRSVKVNVCFSIPLN
jgi:hypothetical protein